MPAIPEVLYQLMSDKAAKHLNIKNRTQYFDEMFKGIAIGIAQGTTSITFTTQDTGFMGSPPIPGVGSGVGITVDTEFLTKTLYTTIREKTISEIGPTLHAPYPPPPDNSGQYLLGICKGISEAITEHFKTAWTLTSTHPVIYSGQAYVNRGNFSGLSAESIANLILNNTPNFKGKFWPTMAKMIAESYVKSITQASTASLVISGFCIPGPTQACGLPGVGTGSGIAS